MHHDQKGVLQMGSQEENSLMCAGSRATLSDSISDFEKVVKYVTMQW